MKRFIAIWILLSTGLNVWQSIRIKELEQRQPIIIHKVDNAGAEMHGRITDKELTGVVKKLEGAWVIDTGNDAVLLWTEVEENEVVGNIYEAPEYLKKRGG